MIALCFTILLLLASAFFTPPTHLTRTCSHGVQHSHATASVPTTTKNQLGVTLHGVDVLLSSVLFRFLFLLQRLGGEHGLWLRFRVRNVDPLWLVCSTLCVPKQGFPGVFLCIVALNTNPHAHTHRNQLHEQPGKAQQHIHTVSPRCLLSCLLLRRNCAKLVVFILWRARGPAEPMSGFFVSTGSFRRAISAWRPVMSSRYMGRAFGLWIWVGRM